MRFRRPLVAIAIAAAAAAAAQVLVSVQLTDGLFGEAERKTVDYRMRNARELQRDSSDVSLILFDSLSVAEWPYQVPFPRAALADLVRMVSANGPTVIGLDVFLDRQYPQLNAQDNGDERLRDAIRDAGNVVLVAPTVQTGSVRRLVRPDPYFADVAAAVASADLPTPFETARDAALMVDTEDGLVPGFALAMYATMRGMDLDSLMRAAERDGGIDLPGLPRASSRLHDGDATQVPVLFAGVPSRPDREEGSFRVYPSYALQLIADFNGFGMNEAIAPWVNGNAVLLGSGFHDSERFRSPFYDQVFEDGEIAGWTYGVEVHANALQNLLDGRHIRNVGGAGALAMLFFVALSASAMTFRSGVKWGLVAPLILLAVIGWVSLEAFSRVSLVVPLVSPVLAAVLAYTGAVAYVSVVEGREKRMIRGAFSRYVPPGVVDSLVADPSRLKLGGEKKLVTIQFSDLAGFTSMSEVLPPEQLVAVLNEYLDEMSDIVLDEQGMLDKYIGDAIMALWGAPTPVADHALRSCRAALRMQRRLEALNSRWAAGATPMDALRMRIGINTGTPVVGNIGGAKRFDYTALGDAVNLAARLEPACKTYGVSIMIAEATRIAAGDAITVRELDMLAVYGKAEPVRVYELVALAGDTADADVTECLRHYNEGLAAYRRRDFELAVSYFEAAVASRREDGPSLMYLRRSEECVLKPPPVDWDFVERRQVK